MVDRQARVPRTKPVLPEPRLEVWAWQRRAACGGREVEEFFVADRLPGDPRAPRGTSDAKAVCSQCPVIAECLAHALSVPERFGVWGGKSAMERERLLQSRALLAQRKGA